MKGVRGEGAMMREREGVSEGGEGVSEGRG